MSGSLDQAAAALFQGGGDMGERMRALDWSATSLGPVARWPESLKTCVRIILTSRQPMFVWWGEELINLYNDAYKSIVGGKHPWALGQPASAVWREIWEQVRPRAERAMRGNEGTYDEALLLIMERHGYQEETYYTFSYSPVPNERGGTGGIICANTDDTQRIIGERRMAVLRDLAARTVDARRPEDVCTQAAAALAEDDRDLPFALIYLTEPGTDAVVLAGAAGVPRGHAAAPHRLLPPSAGASPGPWPVFDVLRDHAPRVVEELSPLTAELPTSPWGRPPSRAIVWPLIPRGQSGRAGALVAALNPYRLYDEEYRSFVGLVAGQIVASVASAQAYEQERQRAEALAEIDRAKTAFFSNVSHEFRTPLTLMLGPEEDALASPERALAGEALQGVHRNTLRLLKLVNNLLDFSRIEAGRAQARYQPTDLPALTIDLASAFRSAIERGGVRFEVDCAPVAEPVFVDRGMWETIVLNLLSNAFKFTLAGHITISLRAVGQRVVLSVADSGVGIPEHELPRMFERFHRIETPEARTHEGSGIGLALVAELVRLHGGEITVSSRHRQGTTFTVSLPLGREHLPPERVSAVADGQSAALARANPFVEEALRWVPAGESGPTRLPAGDGAAGGEAAGPRAQAGWVLVADDNADMRDYLARLLRDHWTVQTVGDGEQALAAARERPPDLILTDAMMPKLDGFGLLQQVRADPRLARTPVIILSARAGEESRVEGLEAGADDYLVKPFQAKELVARVRAHLESARLRRAAETERNRLSGLLGQLPAIVNFLRGPDLIVDFAHPMTIAALGGRQILGLPLEEAVPEFRAQEYPTLIRRVFETGERIEGHESLVRLQDAAAPGGLRDTYWNFVYLPVRDDAGRIEGVMTFNLEVTEQVQARRELEAQSAELARAKVEAEQARALAETANRAKDEFLAMLGHELRNPLSPILTALQLMRMRGQVGREHAVIERQVGHLVRLVDDLLDVSRITRGKIELRREPLELAAAVGAGLEMARPLLEQRRQKLTLDVPAHGLLVQADANRLAQVVSNLLTNAAKYSDPEGTILVSARREGDRARLSVRDNGVGIPPQIIDRIFDVFFQEPQAIDRSKGGLGLGLAIVRNLVDLHGGRVSARSDGPGRGSEFTVELPLAAAAQPAAALPLTPLAGLKPKQRAPGRRILLVDDNADAATSLAELLSQVGFDVRAVHDAVAALEVAPLFKPDFCLLDIGLPIMDGYELAARLRMSRLIDDQTRIIAVTGYGQDADRQRARAAGFDAHIVKPVDMDALMGALGSS